MDQLDREVIESLSEPAKRVFGSLDYRSRQRMLKKARAMAKEEKTRNQKKSRVKKKGIEKQNKAKRKKKAPNVVVEFKISFLDIKLKKNTLSTKFDKMCYHKSIQFVLT